MLVVFLDVKHDCPCHLDLREQVEVSQNEKDLALLLVICFHKLLVGNQVVFHLGIADSF
jgi:hypothetical protein